MVFKICCLILYIYAKSITLINYIFCLNTYSNPMPLGLELNKTTNIDLTKKYKIINKEP